MVRRVEGRRWQQAQRWELDLWTRTARSDRAARLRASLARLGLGMWAIRALGSGDDWNEWWKERFDDYGFLPPDLGDVLELGCGPFTNVRLITRGRRTSRIVCSDPLARRYRSLRGTWLAEASRAGLVEIDDHPAEECPFPDHSFDLVVMINVLDHVLDLDRSLSSAIRVTRPGGILILGQDLSDAGDIERVGVDIGHPIRASHDDLDELIGSGFEPLIHRVLDREDGRNPAAHYGTYIFAGRKVGVESDTKLSGS